MFTLNDKEIADTLLKMLGIDLNLDIPADLWEQLSESPDDKQVQKKVKAWCREQAKNHKWYTGRYRDIYLDETGEKIILRTRNGGGNRPYYFWVFENLKYHPNYIRDYDDEFDSTYAYIEFSIPARHKKLAKQLLAKQPEIPPFGEQIKNFSEICKYLAQLDKKSEEK
jgi:hypothetical protein